MFTEKNLRNIKYFIRDADRSIHYNDLDVSGSPPPGRGGGEGDCDKQRLYRFYICQFTIPASLVFMKSQ
jgi:hypothetical protein